jgi:hypothetical protein
MQFLWAAVYHLNLSVLAKGACLAKAQGENSGLFMRLVFQWWRL